jgi:arylsulfatase A-like enzyme
MMKNVVMILADELRKEVATHERYPFVKTPNLDRIRKEGITFHNCFSQYPVCGPSRASLMTGKYPHQLALLHNKCLIPPEERTIGHHMKDLGCDAVAMGKTHGQNPGFDLYPEPEALASLGTLNMGYRASSEQITGTFRGGKENHYDYVVTRQFEKFLRQRDQNRGFFAFIGFHAPHPPLYPPEELKDLYKPEAIELPEADEREFDSKPVMQREASEWRWLIHPESVRRQMVACYLALVTLIDECVGRVTASLEKAGLLEETILLVTSDHGDLLGDHNMLGKFDCFYEGSLRVPLFMRLPGAEHAGGEVDQLIEMVDIYPTLCELAGAPCPQDIEGRSFTETFGNEDYEHRELIHSMNDKGQMVRTKEWKLACYPEDRGELYHLAEDPEERVNLYEAEGLLAVRERLEREILNHLITFRRTPRLEGFNRFIG